MLASTPLALEDLGAGPPKKARSEFDWQASRKKARGIAARAIEFKDALRKGRVKKIKDRIVIEGQLESRFDACFSEAKKK